MGIGGNGRRFWRQDMCKTKGSQTLTESLMKARGRKSEHTIRMVQSTGNFTNNIETVSREF